MNTRNIFLIKKFFLNESSKNIVENKNSLESIKSIVNLTNEINNSKILSTINIIHENINNRKFEDKSLAKDYINENLKLLMFTTPNKIKKELDLLESNYSSIKHTKTDLVSESIQYLIENKYSTNSTEVNKKFNSYETIIKFLLEEKKELKSENLNLNESVLDIAFSLHNKTLEKLNEKEMSFFNELVESKNHEEFFNSYKEKTIYNLSNINSDKFNNKIEKTKTKISEMIFNKESYLSDVIKLNRLNENILK